MPGSEILGALGPIGVGSRRDFALLAGLSVLAGLTEAAVLVLVAEVAVAVAVDGSVSEPSVGPFEGGEVGIPALLTISVVLVGVRLGLQAVTDKLTARLSREALVHVRRELLDAFLDAPWAAQSEEREGHVQELMGVHAQRVATAVLFVAHGLTALFNFLALLVAALFINFLAAGAIIATSTILFFVLQRVTVRGRRHATDESNADIQYAQAVGESISLAKEIRLFDVADALRARSVRLMTGVGGPYERSRFLGRFLPHLYEGVALAMVLAALGALYVLDPANLASLGAVLLVLFRGLRYSRMVQADHHQVDNLRPYREEILDTIERYRRDRRPVATSRLDRVGTVELRDVSFRYPSGQVALRHVNLRIEPGDAIGVVGPSGAGKTTLTDLLLLLRRPTGGTIQVDGRPLDEISPSSWYRHVAYVPQEPRLVSGTIRENIGFYRREVSDADVEEAGRRAALEGDIAQLPEGYETLVGERGGRLSGGQRQRICLARALAAQPELLVLDEPTSALDIRSEQLIQLALGERRGETTLVVVAHRPSTLTICSRIVVMTGGRVEAVRTPGELDELDGFWRDVTRRASSP